MYLQSFLQPCKMAARTDNALEEIYPALIWLALVSSLQAQILNVDSCSGGPDGNLDAQTTVTARNLGNAPYATQISNQIYTPGSTITVTIIPLLDSARTYQELIIQARLASESVNTASTPVGTFTLVNGIPITSNADFTTLNCNNGVLGSTLATTNANTKTLPRTGITFTYQTPNPAVGAIQFVFTIVLQPTVFYERITSQAFDIASTGPGPIISSCPGNIVEPSDGSAGFIFVSWNEPTSTGIPDSNNEASPNGFFPVGNPTPTSLMYGYSTGGLRNECNFDILLPNIVNPIITSCPEVGTIAVTNVGTTQRQFNYNTPTCSEVGGGSVAVTCMPASGAVVDNTVNSISCTCSIAGNLQAFCTTNNIGGSVNDPPQIAPCPATAQVFTVGVNQAVYVYTTPTCTGPNGDFTSVTCNPASGTVTSVVQQITCTCTDTAGLTDACTISLPAANTPPNAPDCPANGVTVTTVEGIDSAVVTYGPFTCNDAEQGFITATCIPVSGTAFSIGGNNVVTCTCTDNDDLLSTCTFFVNVVGSVNDPPQIAPCPATVQVFTVGVNQAVYVYTTPTCTDPNGDVTSVTCNPASGTVTFVVEQITCTCEDTAGSTDTCTISLPDGNTQPDPPNCPNTAVTVTTVGGSASAVATYGPFICSDAEQGSITATCNPVSGTLFTIAGNNEVTCTCTDNGGLQNNCNFFVNVLAGNTQPGPPNCPNTAVTVTTLGGSTSAVASYGPFVCSDFEQGSITATCNPVSGTSFSIAGNNVVTCTCRDNGGLQNSCNFFVNVLDENTAPNPPNCPTTPVSVTTIPGVTTAAATFGPFTCTDGEQGSILAQCDPVSGSQFSVGSNAVICTCTDDGGLQNACTFVVIVTESSQTSPIWFVSVPSAAFIFGMALLVSVILVLKRRKPKEKQRSDDTPMGVVTNTSRSAGMDEEGYIDPNIENKHSSDGGAKEYTGILPKHGKPETTTSIKTPSGKIYSRNIYDSEDYYFQPIE